jgi:hypothetical protein
VDEGFGMNAIFFIGLITNVIGGAAICASAYLGVEPTYSSGPIAFKSPLWRHAHNGGWIAMVIGFLLQVWAAWY